MSLVLDELFICCRGLGNEKATERKKEMDRFRRLIRSSETAEELDRVSGNRASRQSKQLTWDTVFRYLQRYLQKETELLQSGKANVSASTQANRHKKMQELSSLVKYFIRCANKRGPRLKCGDLLAHIVDVLGGSFTSSAYGEDYSSILLKDVLSIRKYWCEITQQQWHKLLDLYCGLFNGLSRAINRVLLSRIIHAVVQGCCLQTDGLAHTLFSFFSKALGSARQEKHLAVLEHLVSALNVFLRASATNWRARACRLGEELLPSLLCVWAQTRPSPALKEEIVQFFHLQVRVHHPKGAKTQATGAHAEDWAKWQGLLYSLYDALVGEIGQIGSRGKYVTGSRHIAVKENLIELTADICHQLFGNGMHEVTVPHLKGALQDSTQGTPSKRRRIELGWDVIRDHLQPNQDDFDIIPWLQITSVLASRYPSTLGDSELAPLLSALCQLLAGQRRGERGPYVLRCLRDLARCQARRPRPRPGSSQGAELGKLWARLWALTVRGLGSPHTEALSLDLLCALLQGALVPVGREFWKIFTGSACKPSCATVMCLSQLLLKCAVPKSLDLACDSLGAGPEGGGAPCLKEAIVSWLLMNEQGEEMEDSSKPHLVLCRPHDMEFPHLLVPKILLSLMLKDSRAGMLFLQGQSAESTWSPNTPASEGEDSLSKIESLYLQFTFDEEPPASAADLGGAATRPEDAQFTAVPALRERVEQHLLSVADHLLNCYSPDSQATPPECLVRGCSLLTGVLAGYLCTGLLTEEESFRSPLFQKAKSLAQLISEFASMAKSKAAETATVSTLRDVTQLCGDCVGRGSKDPVSVTASSLFLKVLPSRLLTELSEICKVMLTNSCKPGAAVAEDDQKDDDWEEPQTQADRQDDLDLFDDGGEGHSGTNAEKWQSADGSDAQYGTGVRSTLAPELLTNQDAAFLTALEFLCLCARSEFIHGLSFRPAEVRRRLLLLLHQIDRANPLHLHTYLTLLKELPAEDTILTAEDFDSLLGPLADLCSLYRQDQEICTALLLGLLPCIRCLGRAQNQNQAEDMRDVQGALLKVVSGFCILSKTGKCTASVRAGLVRCLVTLLEADPRCKWAVLGLREEELPVSVVLPSHLADAHHHVRMLAAMTVDRLFLEWTPDGSERKRMLPLKLQQKAFENVYLEAQNGMRVQRGGVPEERPDEARNRRATLLKSLAVVLCSSPVCEKQALFALFQAYQENKIDEKLVKKVLESVSRALSYRSGESFVNSHLHYLVTEWLRHYSLGSFPYGLLYHTSLHEFYRSSYHVLVPHLVYLDDFEQVRAVGAELGQDWKQLLADCFPKITVNILPYFAPPGQDGRAAQQREKAHRVYDLLKDSSCLGKEQIDSLIKSNLADIVVELLMTLYEGAGQEEGEESGDLRRFIGELDPAPNPPYFSSYVIKATLDYLSKCHGSSGRSLVAILSKTPISIQKILLAVCQKVAETTNAYERHRILLVYRLFVGLLLREVKEGLGGAWAFVLRDVVYTLIHHINGSPAQLDEVTTRSLSLCLDLLESVCRTAVLFCEDALESHLQVIVGTLTTQVTDQPAISEQVLRLLQFLIMENKDNEHLRRAIQLLEPLPDRPAFRQLREAQHALKYSTGEFTLRQEIEYFLSVSSCDSLPLARLEGLKDLRRLLRTQRGQIRSLLQECQADPADSVLVKLVLSLLQLCKLAVNHPGGADILEAAGSCLGELGPLDLATIALPHGKDRVTARASDLFVDIELRWAFTLFTYMNSALTHHRIEVRQAAAQCLRDILATQTGLEFWAAYKDSKDPMLVYFCPFRSAKKKAVEVRVPEASSDSRAQLESPALWDPQQGQHSDWLRRLCLALLDSGGVQSEALLLSRPLCQVKTDFCQKALPLFVHDVLLRDTDGSWRTLLSNRIGDFFTCCARSSSSSSRSTTPLLPDSGETDFANQGPVDKISLRTMLAVIDYLRHQPRSPPGSSSSQGTVCDANFWLELNYLEVARAAETCSAHFTALLYAEIHVDRRKSTLEDGRRSQSRTSRRILFEDGSQNFAITGLTENGGEDTGISLQDLLIEVYRSIGEPDSLYGCAGAKMASPLTRIRTYEHEAQWGKALATYDLHTSLPDVTRQVGIVEALQNFGLCGTLVTYLRGLESEGADWGAELRELQFQAAWRNTQWDCHLSDRSEKADPGFNESVFYALQALRDKEFSAFSQTLRNTRVSEVEALCRDSLEAVSSLYPALCDLQRISELESVGELCCSGLTELGVAEVLGRWRRHSELLADSDFGLLEPVLALRTAAQETLVLRERDAGRREGLRAALASHLLELCRLARAAGRTQLAERAVFQMKQHGRPSAGTGTSPWQLEEAQVFWAKREQSLALGILRQMIETLSDQVDFNPALSPMYAECLRLCGSWLAETCLESPGVILETYLEKAVEVIEDHPGGEDARLLAQKTQAYLSLARFSDAQYQSMENYMKSSEFENKQALLEKAKEEVHLMKEHNVNTNRYTVKVERELALDERALAGLRADRRRFLLKAVQNYTLCLALGSDQDLWVFRLAALWLGNADDASVNKAVEEAVEKIPSHKFLPLMYQLAARMGTKVPRGTGEDLGFHDVLNELICRASLDHPHHTLFIILALVNANKDENFARTRLSRSTPRQPSQLDKERSDVALRIINEIRKQRGRMVSGLEALCNAYITLAYLDASRHKNEKKAIPIPSDQPIMKIKDLDDIAIPTMEIKVDPTGRYDDLVTIESFRPHYHLAGGLNLPKIIDCVGSDGKARRQLVKGQDDLRQDAVMQQVFQMCSTLLQRNAETRKRKLNIRRYKVVPFSQRSGVLEWCSGTVPLGDFLVDPQKGAHHRFRPADWTSLACRRKMHDAVRSGSDTAQAFSEVCQNFRPVFRYFCMERFLDPAVWMEKRLAYTRSVATSSIVGYIVGLGDRHIQNILIDELSAELVHIDLGVAFEQGKILPTPETVPFRLSRDIVDGMGISGVEGVFRRCCEKTMEVMRSSQEALLTIVEVLLYDPLFDWTMNPLKAFHLQQQHEEQTELNATLSSTPGGDVLDAPGKASDTQSFNKVAERVLLRLQEKLKGVEEGAVLSVSGQVNLLIQQAMDPKNLSRLFPGWQAWV
ncbi:serine-protein kinase ATM [Anguilla anguilla]|uniref:serine-protein kinase ATM n=1 Tax=Anguilla anguilla TaxID=7936 RepID=UPI0015B2D5EE|nr:serine-protein kinase ATM [Anguilla anguilla]